MNACPGTLYRLISLWSLCVWLRLFDKCCRAVQIAAELKSKDGAGPKLKDFKAYVDSNEVSEIKQLKAEVEKYAMDFPTIGFEKADMRYKQ